MTLKQEAFLLPFLMILNTLVIIKSDIFPPKILGFILATLFWATLILIFRRIKRRIADKKNKTE